MVTRRTLLQSSAGALGAQLFAAPKSAKPNAALESLGAVALREAKRLKASYCDIRIIRYRRQALAVSLNPQGGKTVEVPTVSDGSSFGFGVRVIAGGAWGFA